jgi:ADP-ribose pyrophosphatase YjhB (NUDIX family)
MLLDAVIREIAEETMLSVEVDRLIAVYSDPKFQIVDYPDGRAVHFVTCLFECRVIGGILKGSEEGSPWGWFDLASPPDGLLPYAVTWLGDARVSDPTVRVR